MERIAQSEAEAVIDVLADAFARYPAMLYVLGTEQSADTAALRRLVQFFVMARVLRGHPVLGIREYGRLVAAATLTPPEPGPEPPALSDLRDSTWASLGHAARQRYEAFGGAAHSFHIVDPHYHLNMIGVRRAVRGRGLARTLLDAVHELSQSEPASTGVSLTTETPANLPLYEHFGYRRIGHARVGRELETWGFFRPRNTGG